MSRQERRIVVGVDGSESSEAALRWAIRQAKLTGASVDAVIAWRFPSAAHPYPTGAEGAAKNTLKAALAGVSGIEPNVPVRPVVTEGNPAEVLLRAARGADLLVVGNRGRGGLGSALLGSVSLQCVQHARCPVLVFREGMEVRT